MASLLKRTGKGIVSDEEMANIGNGPDDDDVKTVLEVEAPGISYAKHAIYNVLALTAIAFSAYSYIYTCRNQVESSTTVVVEREVNYYNLTLETTGAITSGSHVTTNQVTTGVHVTTSPLTTGTSAFDELNTTIPYEEYNHTDIFVKSTRSANATIRFFKIGRVVTIDIPSIGVQSTLEDDIYVSQIAFPLRFSPILFWHAPIAVYSANVIQADLGEIEILNGFIRLYNSLDPTNRNFPASGISGVFPTSYSYTTIGS